MDRHWRVRRQETAYAEYCNGESLICFCHGQPHDKASPEGAECWLYRYTDELGPRMKENFIQSLDMKQQSKYEKANNN